MQPKQAEGIELSATDISHQNLQPGKSMQVEKTIKTIAVPTYIERVKWIGTALFIIGAVLISVSTFFSSNPWTFGIFLIGHVLWTWVGVEEEDKALVTLNAGMLLMDVVAIWTRVA